MPGPPVPGDADPYRADRFGSEGLRPVQVTELTLRGPAGAGPSTINAKFVNWVRLHRPETGRPVYVLNNHAVPRSRARPAAPTAAHRRG